MNRDRTHTTVSEKRCHEVRVPLRNAEAEGPVSGTALKLLERILRPTLRRHSGRERVFIEAGAPPRDVRVVHFVRHAVVMKRGEQAMSRTFDEITAIDKILLTERKKVASVAPFRRGRQAEQELRTEVRDQFPVRGSGSMVELVDDQVVERIRRGRLCFQMLASDSKFMRLIVTLGRPRYEPGEKVASSTTCPTALSSVPEAEAAGQTLGTDPTVGSNVVGSMTRNLSIVVPLRFRHVPTNRIT